MLPRKERLGSKGKFCMLKPIVDYAKKYQRGYGICAVSRNYALEASLKHTVLWGLPELRGIENCMPETERMGAANLGEKERTGSCASDSGPALGR